MEATHEDVVLPKGMRGVTVVIVEIEGADIPRAAQRSIL